MHFLHLLADALLGRDGVALAQHLGTEDEEEQRRKEVGEAFGDQGWHGVAEDGRENCHGDEGGERGREDDEARVFHCHEGGDQEGFVADLGEDYHCEGEEEGVEGLNKRGGCGGQERQ